MEPEHPIRLVVINELHNNIKKSVSILSNIRVFNKLIDNLRLAQANEDEEDEEELEARIEDIQEPIPPPPTEVELTEDADEFTGDALHIIRLCANNNLIANILYQKAPGPFVKIGDASAYLPCTRPARYFHGYDL